MQAVTNGGDSSTTPKLVSMATPNPTPLPPTGFAQKPGLAQKRVSLHKKSLVRAIGNVNAIIDIPYPTLSRCKKSKNLLPSTEYPAGLLHAIQGRYTDGISP